MKIKIKRISFIDIFLYLTFLCGVFSTMPIVSIKVGERSISLFTFCFTMEIAFLFLYYVIGTDHRIYKNLKKLLIWFLLAGISSVMGSLYSVIYPEMEGKSIAYLPKIIIWILFIFMWETQSKKQEGIRYLARGVLAGCVLNLAWAIIDAVVYYTTRMSLNNLVFSNYIIKGSQYTGRMSLIYNTGLYRAGGFNHDPAHIGFIAPIIAAYAIKTRRYHYLILAFGGVLASASTTGLLCTLFVIGFCLLDDMLVGGGDLQIIGTKGFIWGIAFLSFSVIVLFEFRVQIASVLGSASSLFFERISSTYLSSNMDTPRYYYIRYFLSALIRMGPMIMTGTGFGTASFGYGHDPEASIAMNFSVNDFFDIENTYISYLMDGGIIGFGLFIYYTFTSFNYFHRKCKYNRISDTTTAMSYAGILSTLLVFLFYHYIIFAPQVLLTIVALSQMDYEMKTVKGRQVRSFSKGLINDSI